MRLIFPVLGAAVCLGVWPLAQAQQVYKCGGGRSVTYSQQPCSQRAVNTDEAPVPVKPNPTQVDIRQLERNRVMARSLRQKPDESTEQFETRRRRALLLATDRDECARLDTRIPVEEARMKAPDSPEVLKAEAALADGRKRFADLGC